MPKDPVTNRGDFDAARERARLARLCRKWTGNAVAAEDLAQEAIVAGWRRFQRGALPAEWSSYLTAIARHLCHHWNAQNRREESRLSSLDETPESAFSVVQDTSPATIDPLDTLISAERETLIERAIASLDDATRQMLIARYVDELPLSEIAGRLALTENAATVRLHRSREALRKKFSTTLREEAAALGLLDADTAEGWQTTPIICCRCGEERLEGRFETTDTGQREFSLRCSRCTGQLIGMTSQAVPLDSARVLSGVSGFRPALSRVNRWWQEYLTAAFQKGTVACVRCGHTAKVQVFSTEGIGMRCPTCQEMTFFIRPTGLLYHSDTLHAFWRRYPKLHNLPERRIVCENRPAILATFAARNANAHVEMVFDAETMTVLSSDSF